MSPSCKVEMFPFSLGAERGTGGRGHRGDEREGERVEMLGGEIAIEGTAPHHLYADAGGHIFYAFGTTTTDHRLGRIVLRRPARVSRRA